MKEEGRKTGGEKEGERKVNRGKEADKGRKERCKVVYDSTGPNDHRYYVGKQQSKFELFIWGIQFYVQNCFAQFHVNIFANFLPSISICRRVETFTYFHIISSIRNIYFNGRGRNK